MQSINSNGKIALMRILALIALWCILQGPATASELWVELFEENLVRAEDGDANAQYEVGIMYPKG